MPMLLSCTCGKQLRVPEEVAGKKVQCPVCGHIQRAPHSAPAAEIAIATEAQEFEAEDPRLSTPARPSRRPPPLPEGNSDELADSTPPVVGVTLIPAQKGHEDERWRLEFGDDDVCLADDEGVVVLTIPCAEINQRLQFPSFWLSVTNLQIMEKGTSLYQFRPDKKVVARLRECLNRVLREDPDARRKHRQRGLAMTISGLVCALLAAGLLTYQIASGYLQQHHFRGIGSALIMAIGGVVLAFTGFGMYRKAQRLDREE